MHIPTNYNTIAISKVKAQLYPKVILITSAYSIRSTAKWSATAINNTLDLR
jgi:hypothetical protein